ncbi:MAG: hypothetical protein H8D56_22040 [Planctomycetes bacterium]|nr:hypothetical protein [Planctomycetota bacterium]MBL7143411.1 hypothetical protein [Phycisphaerae bacterium]
MQILAGCRWITVDALMSAPGIYPLDGIFTRDNRDIDGSPGLQIYQVPTARFGQTITIIKSTTSTKGGGLRTGL